jgi:hypothetical protein
MTIIDDLLSLIIGKPVSHGILGTPNPAYPKWLAMKQAERMRREREKAAGDAASRATPPS